MIGTTVGSYRITEKVSVGGMGTVYKAEHELLGKLAAVKVLHPELRNNRDVVNRFFNEAKATTQIKHPGIVEVFDFDYLPSGDGYIVMEFLEGMSLAQRLELRGSMDEGEASMVMRAVCSALAAAHAKQIVHRDLKPDNIFMTPDPDSATGARPKLLDFGIAKLSDANLTGLGSVTKTGAVMGTPTYMSPEQCKGTGEIDHRADFYSIGCIFYELICGRPPFTDMGAGELIGAHVYIEPDPPSKHFPGISPNAEKLILELLAKDPAKRPQTARELAQRFDALAQQHGWITNSSPSGITAVSPTSQRDSLRTPIPSRNTPAAARSPGLAPTIAAPTTLSGAASQSVINLPRSRVGLWAGGIVALGLVAGSVIMFTTRGGDGHAPAAAPPAAAPAPHVEAAAPVAPPPPAPAPVPAPVEPAPTAAPIPAAAPPTPVAPTRTVKPSKRPHDAGPKPIKTVDPKQVKPADPKPGTGSGSAKILIETDL